MDVLTFIKTAVIKNREQMSRKNIEPHYLTPQSILDDEQISCGQTAVIQGQVRFENASRTSNN